MADDNEFIAMNVERNDGNKPWIAVSSPQRMVHNGRPVIYQHLRYSCEGGFRRDYVVVPGYAMSMPYQTKYKGKDVTAFKIERITDKNDMREIENCLSGDYNMRDRIHFWPRERTLQEKERDAIESESLRKKAKVAEDNLLKAMRDNPDVHKFVKGFVDYLDEKKNRIHT